MADAYGDGWNGNILTIGDETFTIDTGAAAQGCYEGPSDVVVTCDGGSWQSEVSWTILDDSGVVLSGGAPYSGCLGTCDDAGGDDGGGDDCVDTDNGATDSYGDGCEGYTAYPSWCNGYDDDDFISCDMCCACADSDACAEPRQGSDDRVSVISTNDALNKQMHSGRVANYKKTSVVQPKVEKPSATTIVDIATGEITTTSEGSRDVSYTVNVSCDDCNAGAPFEGSWIAATSDFLVYGFDAGSDVCATVSGTSTELGTTADSEAACDTAGAEAGCEFFDCSGQEACGYEGWVGDGYCDDGTYGMYFDCDEFDCDGGDCATDCAGTCGGDAVVDDCGECGGDGSSCACTAGDVNGDDTANVQDIVLIVGHILDGDCGDCDIDCADMNADGTVNVQDIVVIVNDILGGRTTSEATEARLNIKDGTVSLDANGFVGAVQMTLSHDASFSIELTNKAMVADYRTNANSTTLIIVAPESNDLFEVSGDFSVEEIIVANANSEVSIAMPTELTLSQAYPNPFNPSTTVDVYVPADGFVSLTVYNVMGQKVDVLHSGSMSEGSHSITWNASSLTTGMYFVRAESTSGVAIQKVMLMK
jgi:hypothetical protein